MIDNLRMKMKIGRSVDEWFYGHVYLSFEREEN